MATSRGSDSTDQRRLEERRFELLINSITNYAIYMVDHEGRVISWNPGAERFKGYAAEEILGKHFSTFYTEEDRLAGKPEASLANAAANGRFEQEGWRLRKNGERFWAAVVISPIHDEATGELIGYAKVTRDITDQREAQEALDRARAALFQSQKMEALGQLTGGVAHDFNNFLTVIVNNLAMIEHLTSDPRILDLVGAAHRAADRGAKLTQQLLAFARRQPLQPRQHDLNVLIREFEALLRRACGKSVEMEFQLNASVPVAEVDRNQFEGALLNLVVNSNDAMPEGGRIVIRTGREEVDNVHAQAGGVPAGSYVRVEVEDNGTGIPADILQRVFEPFFTTKEVGKGTGLGLSQVDGFVRQLGGFVEVASQVGEGTRISVYLPSAGGGSGDPRLAKSGPEGTVLIVEDDPDVMAIAVEIFRGLGYDAVTAGNTSDALSLLEGNENVQIMFSDVVMPNGPNGVELARRARRLRPDLPILLTSGYPQRALAGDLSELSNFHFIAKPYRAADVAAQVHDLRRGLRPDPDSRTG